MKRIREFFESIVFAGMKPASQAAPKPQLKWLGPLRGLAERFLSGGPAPTDPLYLTNRTPGQKLRSWGLIAIPCLVLLGGVAITLSSYLDPPAPPPAKELTAAEITAKLLPNMDRDFKLAPPSVVQAPPLDSRASALHQRAGPACRDCGVIESVVALVPRAQDDAMAYQMRIRMDDGSVRTVKQRGALATGSRVTVANGSVRSVPGRSDPG